MSSEYDLQILMKNYPEQIIKKLGLIKHPEGGFYKETYRSEDKISIPERSVSTSIYYLLTPDTFSEIHSVASDEIFHFYLGDRVEMINLYDDGNSEIIYLSHDILKGDKVQHIVGKNILQGCRLCKGGSFALMGCTVAPGFDFQDYYAPSAENLLKTYTDRSTIIKELTRK